MAFVGGGMLIKESLDLGNAKPEFIIDPLLWMIPFLAAVTLEICYHYVKNVAKKNHSPALAADAVHYRIDSLTSAFATIALLSAAYTPAWSYVFDHMGAIAISGFMIVIGLNISKENLKQLLDTKPEADFFIKVENASKRVSGVKGTEKVRIQQYGPDAHVDIDIEVDPNLSVQLAHEISQKVRVEIQKDWPAVRDVTVHIEPFYPGDH
jgi:cation diffusion facilitator family transporter